MLESFVSTAFWGVPPGSDDGKRQSSLVEVVRCGECDLITPVGRDTHERRIIGNHSSRQFSDLRRRNCPASGERVE